MTTWSYNGTQLSTFGNITLLDDDLDIPDKRGDDLIIPFRHGRLFTEKYFDERKMTFGIEIHRSTKAALETAIDNLKKLISVRSLKTLSQTREDTTVRTAEATVERSLQINREGPLFARAVIEFTIPGAFFRGSSLISNEVTVNASPKAMVINNTGTVEERDPTIILTGPLQNTTITNAANGTVFYYTGTIAGGTIITVLTSLGRYVATDNLGNNMIGNIGHDNSSALLVLDTDTNNLSIVDSTHTTGKVKIEFYPPYL